MSSDIAIRVENLGKMYRIGGPQARYSTFRETLTDAFVAPFRRAGRLLRGGGTAADLDQTIWALRDVSFELKRGEVVGIIGRNGAGKSTLLKILSRITTPTEGEADIYGRVGSLLEVGTGFHPELTGRENIYLNGAILGMRRVEIDRNLDEIVAFAEIEKFLDTPVKHYSSGMYVRLAFAVAAHLDTEVLLIDEVLAVGDARFQRRCLDKLGDVARSGRTVAFVSHNMAAIQALCGRTLLIRDGQIGFEGSTTEGIRMYLNANSKSNPETDLANVSVVQTGFIPALNSIRMFDSRGLPCTVFPLGADIGFEIDLISDAPIQNPGLGIGCNNSLGSRVFTVMPKFSGIEPPPLEGSMTVRCVLRSPNLCPGSYYFKIAFSDGHGDREIVENLPVFEIAATDRWGAGVLPVPITQGLIVQDAEWSFLDSPAKRTRQQNGQAILDG